VEEEEEEEEEEPDLSVDRAVIKEESTGVVTGAKEDGLCSRI